MGLSDLFRRQPRVTVHVMIRGRIGEGWIEVDRALRVPEGSTLGETLALGEKKGIPFAEALANSPPLRDTLMLNGERCPVAEHQDRIMADGDELYLLAPIAGG